MMNQQQHGPGLRGNRGNRGHHHHGRYQHNRFPHQSFRNPNYNPNNNNNNNSQKCYDQNLEHCPPNGNVDHGEYMPHPEQRQFANAGGNPPYLGNDAGYPMEPHFHNHGQHVMYNVPQFTQQPFPDMGMPPPLMPPMQLMSYPQQQFVYYGPQGGMPPPPPSEQMNLSKDVGTLSISRESFGNEMDQGYVAACANCAGLQAELSTLHAKHRDLIEENVELRIRLRKKEEREEPTENTTVLSVNAEPFVVHATATGDGGKWPLDPVDQGYEKTCTELCEIIKDKPEDTWTSPDVAAKTVVPPASPIPPIYSIPVVSANGRWSDLMDSEHDSGADGPGAYSSRGRVMPEEHGLPPGLPQQPPRNNPGPNRPPPGLNFPAAAPGDDRGGGNRGPRRQDKRGQDNVNPLQFRGPSMAQAPDPNQRGYQQTRNAQGGNRRNQNNPGYRGEQRLFGQNRQLETNWRADSKKAEPSAEAELNRSVGGDEEEKTCDGTEEQVEDAAEGIKGVELKREESVERKGGRSNSYQAGGSGDRLRSQHDRDARSPAQGAGFITEMNGDLFTADASFSLAHCVAEDLQMGSGIAVTFRDTFKRVHELLDQRKKTGEVAILSDNGRFIYYLVTKVRSQGKPTMPSLESSLWLMAEHCVAHGVQRLAMPRIGCGLDRLNWKSVKELLERVFDRSGVQITVYNYPQHDERKDETTQRKKSSLFIVQKAMKLPEIAANTGFLIACAEDGTTLASLDALNNKFNIAPLFKAAKLACGEAVRFEKNNEVFYFLVVKKTKKDPLSYGHLFTSLRMLRKMNDKDCYEYFGIDAFRDGNDELTMAKVCTMLRNVFGGLKHMLEAWVCFNDALVKDMDVPTPPMT